MRSEALTTPKRSAVGMILPRAESFGERRRQLFGALHEFVHHDHVDVGRAGGKVFAQIGRCFR